MSIPPAITLHGPEVPEPARVLVPDTDELGWRLGRFENVGSMGVTVAACPVYFESDGQIRWYANDAITVIRPPTA